MHDPFSGKILLAEGSSFKDDLKSRAQEKLKELGDFPSYITSDLRDRIIELQKEFLYLRQTKKFTEEKGIEINQKIDELNKDLIELVNKLRTKQKTKGEEEEEEEEYRKRKFLKPKMKRTKTIRKVCKCRK
jgi:predicted phage gp36 major capsid-like protein